MPAGPPPITSIFFDFSAGLNPGSPSSIKAGFTEQDRFTPLLRKRVRQPVSKQLLQ
jgi:hypothetical protein